MHQERAVTDSQKKSKTQSKLKIKSNQKIAIGFITVITIFLVLGVLIYLNETSVEKVTSHFSDEVIPELEALQELKTSSLRILSSTMDMVVIFNESVLVEQEFLEEERAEISDAKIKFENALVTLHDLVSDDPDELSKFNQINDEWKELVRISEELIQAKESGIKGEAIMELKEELEDVENHLLQVLSDAIDHELHEVNEESELVKSLFENNLQIIFFGVVLVTVVSIIIGWIISKKIDYDQKTITEQITELKKLDKQKNEFLSMLSHELRTPLVPILGICEIILDKDSEELSEEQRKLIQSVASNSKRLGTLIEKLLLTQKLALGKYDYLMEYLNVKDFMDDINTSYSPIMSERQIEFVNSTKDGDVVYGDEKSIHQIFNNLISNAIDFVPKENPRIEIGAQSDNDNIIFYVKDNGVGIPPELQEKIFNKLYQVDSTLARQHGGLGIGLAICKKLVTEMGGTIWVESQEGKGASFYFTLKKVG